MCSLSRPPEIYRPPHSSSGSWDHAANDPTVRCRIYLKNQLNSGRTPTPVPAQRHQGPKPAESALAGAGRLRTRRRRCCRCLRTESRPQQASHGRPGLPTGPHHQETRHWTQRTRWGTVLLIYILFYFAVLEHAEKHFSFLKMSKNP